MSFSRETTYSDAYLYKLLDGTKVNSYSRAKLWAGNIVGIGCVDILYQRVAAYIPVEKNKRPDR